MTDTTAALDEKPGFETGYRTKGYRAYVLGSLLIVYIFNFIDRSIFGILTDPIRNSLGLEDWQMGLLGGLAFATFYTTLGIPIARFSEKTSRMMIIVASLTMWSLMTVLCGFAVSFATMFAFRLLVGVGEAGCTPPPQSTRLACRLVACAPVSPQARSMIMLRARMSTPCWKDGAGLGSQT